MWPCLLESERWLQCAWQRLWVAPALWSKSVNPTTTMGWGILAGLGAGALWGLVFVAPRMVTSWSAVDFTAGRFLSYGFLSAMLVFWPVLRGRPAMLPNWAQAKAAILMSLLGFTGYYLLLVFSIRDVGSELPSLIIGTIPLWMMLLGKPQGLRWPVLVPGLLLTLAGLVLMVVASWSSLAVEGSNPITNPVTSQAAQGGWPFWRGIALASASMVCWTAFGLLNARWLKQNPLVDASTWANWLGLATGLGALGLWLVAGSELKTLESATNTAQNAILSIATGVGSAWLATVWWNIASQRLSASLCGQLIVSETIFALLFSFMWDGHWPSLVQGLAIGLFIAGILASIRAHR